MLTSAEVEFIVGTPGPFHRRARGPRCERETGLGLHVGYALSYADVREMQKKYSDGISSDADHLATPLHGISGPRQAGSGGDQAARGYHRQMAGPLTSPPTTHSGEDSGAVDRGSAPHRPGPDLTRVAVFSDLHGNAAALDAVLSDAESARVEAFWVVGDLISDGPRPVEVLRRLRELPRALFVRGNTDRYVLTGDLPDVLRDRPQFEVAAASSFAWTRGAISAAGHYEWLAGIPVEHHATLPNGDRVLLVHASPGCDDGSGIQESMSDPDLVARRVTPEIADLIFVGHTHIPLDRTVGATRVVNLGSVSLPATTERRAMWALLTADSAGWQVERRFSRYDVECVCADLDAVHHPSAAWLRDKFHRSRR